MSFETTAIRAQAALKSLGRLSLFEVFTNGFDLNIPKTPFMQVLLSGCDRYVHPSRIQVHEEDLETQKTEGPHYTFDSLKLDPEPMAPASRLFFPSDRSLEYTSVVATRELLKIRGL